MKSKITTIIGWLLGKTSKKLDHIEVERRWLMHPSNFIPFRQMNGGIFDSATIRQAYVIDAYGACLRIRSSIKANTESAFITCKGTTIDSPYSSEYEMSIPYDLAEKLMANQKVMTKVRHRVYHKNYMVEVDSFSDDAINAHLGGYLIAEIEFPDVESASKFTAPSFFGKEVTADKKRYSNAAMFKLL